MDDKKLEVDEQRRLAEHEAIKRRVQGDVHGEIEQRTGRLDAAETAEVRGVAGELKHAALTEVAQTETEIERARRTARIRQVVDYVFFVAYGLIGMEIVLELIGARDGSGFKRFIDVVSWPLLAPFRGLLPTPEAGTVSFPLAYVFGLVAWMLVHLAVRGLLHVIARRETRV